MELRRIQLLILLGLFWLSATAQMEELYLKGVAFAKNGSHAEARNSFEDVLKLDSDNPECLLEMARVCNLSGDREAAIEYLQELEAINPGMGSYELAKISAEEGRADETVKYLEIHLSSIYKLPYSRIMLDDAFAAVENSPLWHRLWTRNWYSEDEEFLNEIEYLTGSGDHLQALEKIDEVRKNRKDWGALFAARGRVLFEMGQKQGAVQSYSDAIKLNNANPGYYTGRAVAYTAQDKHSLAVTDLEKAYRIAPEQFNLLLLIARQYQLDKQYTKAVSSLENYLEYFPGDINAIYQAGQISYESGSYLDALRRYNSCLQIDTTNPGYFIARGKTYMMTKTYKYALNDFGMALDLDPDDPETWYLKAQVRWLAGDSQGAMGDWEKAAKLGSYKAVEKLEEHGPR